MCEMECWDNSYFYIEKWTFKVICEVFYRAKRDKKETMMTFHFEGQNGAFLHGMGYANYHQ